MPSGYTTNTQISGTASIDLSLYQDRGYLCFAGDPGLSGTMLGAFYFDDVAIRADSCSGAPDSDGDGVPDPVDNCIDVANPNQRDSNFDYFGNACDADFNGDCVVNPVDLGIFRSAFFSSDPDADLNGDGVVNPIDLGIFRSLFFLAPGPSGLAVCP